MFFAYLYCNKNTTMKSFELTQNLKSVYGENLNLIYLEDEKFWVKKIEGRTERSEVIDGEIVMFDSLEDAIKNSRVLTPGEPVLLIDCIGTDAADWVLTVISSGKNPAT